MGASVLSQQTAWYLSWYWMARCLGGWLTVDFHCNCIKKKELVSQWPPNDENGASSKLTD